MNEIIIMDEKGNLLTTLSGYWVPDVGETIWLDNSKANPDFRVITSRLFDVEKDRRRFKITLFVK